MFYKIKTFIAPFLSIFFSINNDQLRILGEATTVIAVGGDAIDGDRA